MPYFEKGLKHFSFTVVFVCLVIFIMAFDNRNIKGEANLGDFSSTDFSKEWMITVGDGEGKLCDLPQNPKAKTGDTIVASKMLPQELSDGMSLMIRTNMQDVEIYIDGALVEAYKSSNFEKMSYYLPSAYVVAELDSEDAGKIVELRYLVKGTSIINCVYISNGNNVWFGPLKSSILLTIGSIMILSLGLFAIIMYLCLRKKIVVSNSVFYNSMLLLIVGIWMISESKLRQLIFNRPSLSSIFSYLSMEIIGIFVALYFNEVQHKKYEKVYMIYGLTVALQIVVAIVLNMTHIAEFYQTLILSHVVLAIGIVLVLSNIIKDIFNHNIREYMITAIGMACFLVSAVFEIFIFYLDDTIRSFGTFLCIGLLLLLIATVTQALFDISSQNEMREKAKEESWIGTIETIASTIDAKDEYTGGHSNRVSEYAGILAREMAVDYDFTEEDILQIKYIGLMHDIGKIGVADTVLNKTGRLTDEEFSLMKKHVEIGGNLLSSMDANMSGLIDGVKHHHERFDGHGYPDGLAGTDIPLIARILCLADSYDAMTSNRVYRRRLNDEEVRAEILKCAGTQFDPALTEIFVRLIDKGMIFPITSGGMEVDARGQLLKSSIIESRLQKDIVAGIDVPNPSHVRMASYIMKLAENKNQQFNAYLLFDSNAENQQNNEAYVSLLKSFLQSKDINIQYTKNSKLIVLFGRNQAALQEFLDDANRYATVEEV